MKEKYHIYEVLIELTVLQDITQKITWMSYGKDVNEATRRTIEDMRKAFTGDSYQIISVKLKNDDWEDV